MTKMMTINKTSCVMLLVELLLCLLSVKSTNAIKKESRAIITAVDNDMEERQFLMNHTGCMYAFVKGGKYKIRTGDNKYMEGNIHPTSVSFDETKTKCPTATNSGKLVFGFQINGSLVKNLQVSMRIHVNETQRFWKISSANITLVREDIDKKRTFPAIIKDMMAGLDYSYSCSSLKLKNSMGKVQPTNETDKQPPMLSLVLHRFQLQPFGSDGITVFAQSDDCSSWMTLPEVAGLILVLFMLTIITIGVHFLLNIEINDFNDVKAAVKFTQLQNEGHKMNN